MDKIYTNKEEVAKWFRDNGDGTHIINYNLNEDSIIMDLGGYTGVWAKQMIDKYNPNVYILEPVPQFYDGMVNRFKDNKKVRLMNVGVGIENKDGLIFMDNDSTSSNLTTNNSIKVTFSTIDSILGKWGINEVDLLQINIEGDEYPLLEYMIEKGLLIKFKNIQVQFHSISESNINRRAKIREALIANGFKNKFDYPFVWESWGSKN